MTTLARVVLAFVLLEGGASASGPALPTARFWSSSAPSEPLDRYLDGHLGILEPTYGTLYLTVAYRHLSGLGIDADSRPAVAGCFASPPPADAHVPSATQRWEEARRKVVPDYHFVSPWREYETKAGSEEYRVFFLNCADDAFATAASTLDDRIARLGRDSPEVRAWLAAQDQVFSNCDHGESIPEPLPDGPTPRTRADGTYQIAAAHFYALHFTDAERLFRDIAADRSSPWSSLGAYLVARAMLRDAVLRRDADREALRRVDAYLRELLADASRADVHPAARRLLDLVDVELDPDARRRALAETRTAPSLREPLRPVMADYVWMLRRYGYPEPSPPDVDELTDWLEAARPVERWRASHSLP